MSGPGTHGHSLKLEKRDCKSRISANFFGYRVVNVWNSLPEDVVSASSVNCLKGRLDSLFGKWQVVRKLGRNWTDLYPEWSQLHPTWMNSLQATPCLRDCNRWWWCWWWWRC